MRTSLSSAQGANRARNPSSHAAGRAEHDEKTEYSHGHKSSNHGDAGNQKPIQESAPEIDYQLKRKSLKSAYRESPTKKSQHGAS